ncbi:Putative alkyl/aryl-sulfatase YjcS [Sinobacterium norvegicum]|uniref:Alkyl/aryl-sulfatase YjcS n=1 Tax=Sinobacterium norvegicum TaxID=1641715 RepID=A0ABN8EGR9_9GAMM|nr:MBL fold metallo-hydrolase [Sinobacterium norvegicum]CAH0991189.1 Putative alkyl/aryl-sulfatase YjcS [Sinobacterium norvegicum]
MRTPLYQSRPYAPFSARFGGERVNDFIVMSEGCSNSYLIETTEGNILVNTGMGYEAPVHYKNYQDLSNADNIQYVISTQGHVDHVGGVQFFRDRNQGLQYIAQSGNHEHQEYDERLRPFRSQRAAFRFLDSFQKDFAYYAEQGYTDINGQDSPTPDITFDDYYDFSLGGLEVVLVGVKGAETNDSLVVWLPQHKICLTGNIFGCPFGHFPNLVTIRGDRYRDAITCAEAAQTVLDLNAEVILYGHHAPVMGADLIKTEVTAIRDAILYVHDETVKGMNEGKDLHTLMREITLPAECEVGQGYGKVSWSVRAIWEGYAGWFHHQSTTELYSVPASDVYSDLVELAGVDALVERAQGKADAGELEQCLHLVDIVMAVEPQHESAVALAISVHQQLLAQADNFWLNGWLENQIKLLKGGKTASLSFK